MSLLLVAIATVAASGVPGLLLGRRSAVGQVVAAALSVAGSLVGLAGIVQWWSEGGDAAPLTGSAAHGPSLVPIEGLFQVGLDSLSAVFLLPIFLVSMCGAVYGLGYWKQAEHPENGRKLRLFYGGLTAGMALLVVARHSILFLIGWELMALSAYFLVTTEDQDSQVRETGWIYLVATHLATLLLIALFALMRSVSGTFAWGAPLGAETPPAIVTAMFLLALVGFGLKAGIMPLHVWLPSAHAIAPSHVSALMSGVILKMGIYGLVRTASLLPEPPVWWGGVVLALGGVSGVLGLAFGLGQHDLKRLLAYSSIENIGVIFLGLGLALVGRSLHRADWIVLGLSGALMHVWNHALFKSLLFYGAGSVIHAVHTRQMNHLGGLLRRMPWTAGCFLVGAAATCALPPLNGFVSELMIYIGLFRTMLPGTPSAAPAWAGAALAAPVLALVGALATTAFVNAVGTVFLGGPRTTRAAEAHESPPSMTAPLVLLAAGCGVLGIVPSLAAPLLEQAAGRWAPETLSSRLLDLAPLGAVGSFQALLLIAGGLGFVLLRMQMRRRVVDRGLTWGCGYAAPTPRMQYTASSFAQMLVGLFTWALHPEAHEPRVRALFPRAAEYSSLVRDAVLDGVLLPASARLAAAFSWFRWLQQGSVQAYLVYILATVMLLLLWR